MKYEKFDLEEANRQFVSLISKTEKVLLKLQKGTPQYTLCIRRLAAYKLAVSLIEKHLQDNLTEDTIS